MRMRAWLPHTTHTVCIVQMYNAKRLSPAIPTARSLQAIPGLSTMPHHDMPRRLLPGNTRARLYAAVCALTIMACMVHVT